MKRVLQIRSLLLTAIFLLFLGGCRSGPASGSGAAAPGTDAPPAEGHTDHAPEIKDGPPEDHGPVRLLLTYDPSRGSTVEGRDRVGRELAAMAEAAAGVPAEITWAEQKEAAAFLAAAVEDGEVFDLYAGGTDAAALEPQGVFSYIPASQIETYAPDFAALMASYIRPLWEYRGENKDPIEHSIALFPLYQSASEALFMDFRADLCQAAGYTKEDVETMSDWNQVYFLMKAAQAAAGEDFVGLTSTRKYDRLGSGLIGPNLFCSGSRFADAVVYDNLGDPLNLIGSTAGEDAGFAYCFWVTSWGGNSPNAGQAMPYIQARYDVQDRLSAWLQEGLILPDSGTSAYSGDPADVFARIYRASELTRSDPTRFRVKITNTMFTAVDAARGYFAIPASSRQPEAALRILNMIYAPATAGAWANLMVYGQARTDYALTGDGRFTAPAEGEVSYRNAALGCSGLFLGEWVDEEPGVRMLQTKALENMQLSPYYGFTTVTSCDETLLQALRNLASEYIPRLTWGQTYGALRDKSGPIAALENVEFSAALLEAGIGDYIRLYQARLNDWLAH